jgi:EAL domain-containing protein (putative c-di-GMP-specific phosphodiesterase class I)
MSVADLDLVPELTRALADDALVVHYQPVVDLADGAVVGMEALVRWQHPRRGLLWPAEFSPVADRAGLLPLLGGEVLRRCAAELASWGTLSAPADGTPRQLLVRVFAAQVLSVEFAERLAALVADNRLAPDTLVLELSADVLATGSRHAPALLAELRAAGVALAIDGFAGWYGSLATVGDLPITVVKLDRAFVRGVGSELEDDTVVAAMVALAHARGVCVVADGVESWTEGARLCELGCDRATGYLFSGPQDADDARLMLAHGAGWDAPVRQRAPDTV